MWICSRGPWKYDHGMPQPCVDWDLIGVTLHQVGASHGYTLKADMNEHTTLNNVMYLGRCSQKDKGGTVDYYCGSWGLLFLTTLTTEPRWKSPNQSSGIIVVPLPICLFIVNIDYYMYRFNNPGSKGRIIFFIVMFYILKIQSLKSWV